MEPKLKACPFCGSKAYLKENKLSLWHIAYIYCKNCSLSMESNLFQTRMKAITGVSTKWNTREGETYGMD